MKKIHSTILVFLLTLFSTITLLIAVCPSVTIFFANGMNNDPAMAEKSKEALEAKLRPLLPPGLDADFQLAYNQNEEAFLGAVEVAEAGAQKAADIWKSFLNFLSGMEVAPDWFQEGVNKIISDMDSANYVIDGDLQNHVAAYRDEIENKHRQVIVVAHSQGNFYANAAYSLVNNPANFHIVAVATPSDYVAGNGPWVTLPTDVVINGVVRPLSTLANPLFGPPKPSNVPANNTDGNGDWKKHDFVSSYLEGDVTGDEIVKDVKSAMGDTSECKADEPPPAEPAQPEQPAPSPEPPADTSIATGPGCGQEGTPYFVPSFSKENTVAVQKRTFACEDIAGAGSIVYEADAPSFTPEYEVSFGSKNDINGICYSSHSNLQPGKYLLVFSVIQLIDPVDPVDPGYDVCGGNKVVFSGNQHSLFDDAFPLPNSTPGSRWADFTMPFEVLP